ncbi:hypothetical protein Taro_054608 [Colocasia esculenta]|uniref:Uncharacterized protein n=1 Tax=Colocasia esculenta TaxID=4460 RepID=A0A843XQJ6_COLES|nr:hypothetical protein [Colocasia esculenta]
MTHPLEEKSCELVVEVPSGEFMLTSSYIDEAPVVIGGNQMPGQNFFLDDSNVTSRIFRIVMDPMFSGCDGYHEANVVCVWYVCVFQGLIGPIVWVCSTLVSSACHRDRKECRVLNTTEVIVALWWPPWGVDRLHVRHV